MIDERLLGTWQSDTRKTMRDIRNRRDIPEESHKRLKRLLAGGLSSPTGSSRQPGGSSGCLRTKRNVIY